LSLQVATYYIGVMDIQLGRDVQCRVTKTLCQLVDVYLNLFILTYILSMF
jgi:hypothetical protein